MVLRMLRSAFAGQFRQQPTQNQQAGSSLAAQSASLLGTMPNQPTSVDLLSGAVFSGPIATMPESSSTQQLHIQAAGMQTLPTQGSGAIYPSYPPFLISSELAMAKQRADKAAAGRRQSVAMKRKLKKQQPPRRTIQVDQSADIDVLDEESQKLQQAVDNATDEKEAKRLKRLLRNRVSAQQARERRKVYVTDLEAKVQAQESQIAELQQQVESLQRENQLLKAQVHGGSTNNFISDLLQPFDTDLMTENGL